MILALAVVLIMTAALAYVLLQARNGKLGVVGTVLITVIWILAVRYAYEWAVR